MAQTQAPKCSKCGATLGPAKWTLVKAGKTTTLPQTFGDPKTTQAMYVVVVIQVENVGDDSISVAPLGLQDSRGREFNQSSSGFDLEPEALLLTKSINPGLILTYSNVYEVPKDATGFVVHISDTRMLGTTALLSLGELGEWEAGE